ncbi:MAG: cupin domain-containing protein [Ketobacteraceae bacterium]|nr:cupin domain-containing protein [Ketobacteraceae bacterium]
MMDIRLRILFLLLAMPVLCAPVFAEQILQTGTAWDGGKIAYPDGDPEVTAIILRLDKEQISKFHCHPVPTLGYVLKGTVEVETREGKTVRLSEGDAAVEVMRTLHRGKAVDGPVEILVFYAGAEGIPTTVLPDTEAAKIHCD